jgi:hypothetical protein
VSDDRGINPIANPINTQLPKAIPITRRAR